MRRYPAYRASGTAWVAELPAHWGLSRLRYCTTQVTSGGTPDSVDARCWAQPGDPQGIAWVSIGDMTRSAVIRTTERQLTPFGLASRRLTVFPPGTLLYSICATLGKTAVLARPAAINQAILALAVDPTVATTAYLQRWLDHLERHLRCLASNNAQDNINASKVRGLPVALPPLDEQRAITAFLDHEAGKLDALIAEQQQLAERLAEKRLALIFHAVTRGLDTAAPTRAAGARWLSEVPAHWEVDRLRRSVASCRNGVWGGEPRGDADDILCVRVADFDRRTLQVRLTEPTLRSVPRRDRESRAVMRGDLLLEKSGGSELYPVGCVVLYDLAEPAVCSNFVARIRLAPGLCPSYWRYLHAAAHAARLSARATKQTFGIQNLDAQRYLDELVPFPPLAEQRRIADHLDRATEQLDALVAQAQHAIELLHERRAALVTAATTGALDVRP